MHVNLKHLAASLLTVCTAAGIQANIVMGADTISNTVKADSAETQVAKAKTEAAPVKAEVPQAQPAEVVAKVNGTAITHAELDRAVQMLLAQSQVPQELSPEIKKQAEDSALEQLISAELLYQKGIKLEIKDLNKQVEAKLSQGKTRFSTPAEYEAALKANNLTEKDLREIIRKDVVINNLFEKEIAGKIVVSEAEVKKFYEENQDKFKKPETYHASHILIGADPQAKPEEKKKAREKAEALQKRVAAGEDFAALAKAESSCPSKDNGGDLGTFGKGEMVPEFEKALDGLKPGQISGVVETQFGYHIIKLIEKKDAGSVGLAEVKDQIENYLKQTKTQQVVLDYVKELRSKATVEKPTPKSP